jgi:O-antigen/teichoic acid export membrane protein
MKIAEHTKERLDHRRFGRNAMWLGSATAGGMLASFLYVTWMARYLGPSDFGRYSLIVAVTGWLISVGQGGGTTALIVLTAQDPGRRRDFLKPGVMIQLAVGLTAVMVGWVAIWYSTHDARLLAPTLWYGLASTAQLIFSVPTSIQRGLDHMEWAWALAIAQILTLALIPVLAWFHAGLTATVAANASACCAVCLFVLPLSWRLIKSPPAANKAPILRSLIASSAGLWIVTALQWIHWKTGLLIVQTLAGSHAVGIYSAGIRVVEALRIVPWLVLMVILPSLAKCADDDRRRAGPLVRNSLRFLMVLAFPIASVLILFAPRLMGGIYTQEFASSSTVFRLAALGFIPGCAHWVFLNALVAFRAHLALIKAYSASIAVQSITSALLMRRFGPPGAVIAGILAELLVAVICGLCVARLVGTPMDAATLRLVPAGVCIVACSVARAAAGPVALWWALALCSLYFVAAFSVRAITCSELLALLRRFLVPHEKSDDLVKRAALVPEDV